MYGALLETPSTSLETACAAGGFLVIHHDMKLGAGAPCLQTLLPPLMKRLNFLRQSQNKRTRRFRRVLRFQVSVSGSVKSDDLPPSHADREPDSGVHRADDRAVAPPFTLADVACAEVDGAAAVAVMRE